MTRPPAREYLREAVYPTLQLALAALAAESLEAKDPLDVLIQCFEAESDR
eukprot:SAG22_NODE_12154_length_454_cov_1.118310_2_plen_49_part_01